VTFHDALYVPGSSTARQALLGRRAHGASEGLLRLLQARDDVPNDYDSPNPVAFLTVRPKCRLLLALSGPSEWTELAAQLLADALKNWGVGGKTAAGYGIGTVRRLEAARRLSGRAGALG
jgi:CRISPR-associated protein Cmr6